MALTLITPPAIEPVSLDQAKSQLRLTISEDDALLQLYIIAARDYAERWMRRSFITTTWELRLDGFPNSGFLRFTHQFGHGQNRGAERHGDFFDDEAIRLPRAPLQSVTSIQFVDTAGNLQTLAATEFVVDANSEPGRIIEAPGSTWPDTEDTVSAVIIRFQAGYGATADSVPAPIRQAILMLVADSYEHAEANIEVIARENKAATRLMNIYRLKEAV